LFRAGQKESSCHLSWPSRRARPCAPAVIFSASKQQSHPIISYRSIILSKHHHQRKQHSLGSNYARSHATPRPPPQFHCHSLRKTQSRRTILPTPFSSYTADLGRRIVLQTNYLRRNNHSCSHNVREPAQIETRTSFSNSIALTSDTTRHILDLDSRV